MSKKSLTKSLKQWAIIETKRKEKNIGRWTTYIYSGGALHTSEIDGVDCLRHERLTNYICEWNSIKEMKE